MKTKHFATILTAGLLLLAVTARADDESNRLGVGANYWTTVKNLDIHDIDRHGFSWLASYQYWPSLIGIEADAEWLKKGFAGATKDVYEPEAYVLLGGTIYGAVGIGGYYTDGSWGDKPFYAFRAGVNFELLPRLYLDINADYRFEHWKGLEASDINSNTITLGAAARFAF